jgi:Flp pilus assembly protein TadD
MHAIQIQPDDARIHGTLGLIEMRTGDPEAASASFARAIELDPALADPWANRAIIAYRRGDIGGARHDLTEALARREDAVILCNRAKTFEAEQRWQEAADDYARAMTLEGADKEAIGERRARCLAAIGQPRRRPKPTAADRSGSSASG